jgi:chemotaxis protein histidine kinase CheA
MPGISGAAIMENGLVALIVDVPGLLRDVKRMAARPARPKRWPDKLLWGESQGESSDV